MKKLLIILFIGVLSACKVEEEPLRVAAAASLTNVFLALEDQYEAKYGPVDFVFGATGTLKEQIKNGAPYDLFFAADDTSVPTLADEGYILENSIELFATGKLAMISNTKMSSIESLLASDITYVALADPELAPYGVAAKEFLIAKELYQDLEEKLVYGSNVSNTLEYCRTGNADVCFVSLSLLQSDDTYLLIPEEYYSPLNQSFGVVSSSQKEVELFIEFLKTLEVREVFAEYGYSVPN